MAEPTRDDPLGQRPDPTSMSEMLEAVVDARIERRIRGRSRDRFQGVADADLVLELLARGWAVYLPTGNKDASC